MYLEEDTETAPAPAISLPPVLIVDDDKMYTLALRRFLQTRGVGVVICHDARQALSLPAGAYRAAVIDVFLEGDRDGLTLVRRLLALQGDLPVIVMSGGSADELRESVLESGATHFITKPFRLSHLLTLLEHLLRQTQNAATRPGSDEGAVDVATAAA